MNRSGWTYKNLGSITSYPSSRVALANISTQQYVGVETLVKNRGGICFSDSLPNADNAIEFIADDILIGNIRPYLKKIWKADRKGGASADVINVRILPEWKTLLLPEYLYVVLSSDKFFDYDNANTHGAKMPRGDKRAIAKFVVPIPPVELQSSIVNEINLINDSIKLQQQQLKDLDTLAQALFYDMFGDPITNPKGWEVQRISNIAAVKTGPFGSLLHKEDYVTGGTPLVNPIHMKDFKIIPDNDFTISSDKLKELSSFILATGDVVLARRGDIGRCAVVSKTENGYLCGTGSLFIRFLHSVDSTFIMYVVKSKSFSTALKNLAKGATMLNLNSSVVGSLKIILPPINMQKTFANKIAAINNSKTSLNIQIVEMQNLLASRMQYWFN